MGPAQLAADVVPGEQAGGPVRPRAGDRRGLDLLQRPGQLLPHRQQPARLAETTSQVFLGVRLQCAKCHHHPFETWSQDDYYGLAAFFARVGTKQSQEFGLFGRETVIMVKPDGEVGHPQTGKP